MKVVKSVSFVWILSGADYTAAVHQVLLRDIRLRSQQGAQSLSTVATGLLEINKSFKFEWLLVAVCHLDRIEMGCSTREEPETEQGDGIKAESSHMAATQHLASLLRLPDANQSPRDLSAAWLVEIYCSSEPLTFIKDDSSHRRKTRRSPDKRSNAKFQA